MLLEQGACSEGLPEAGEFGVLPAPWEGLSAGPAFPLSLATGFTPTRPWHHGSQARGE